MEFTGLDTFSKYGATKLATKIQLYWTMLGLDGVRAWIEPIPFQDELFHVRSNVVEILCGSRHTDSDSVLRRPSVRTVH